MPIYAPYLLFVYALWALGILLLIGRSDFPLLLRLMTLLVWLLFGFLMEDQLYLAYWDWRDHPIRMLQIIYRTVGGVVFAFLVVAWPMQLILIFYKADYKGAAKILKAMIILSLIFFVGLVIEIYFGGYLIWER